MASFVRMLVVAVLASGLLIGCTRDRPAPEAMDTPASLDAPVTAAVVTREPDVVAVTPTVTAEAGGDADATADSTPEAETTPAIFQYVVQDGDTISSIADKFETTVETMRQLNYLVDDNIFAGQQLDIPYKEGMTAEGAPTPTPAPFVYVVQSGDTLGSIAANFGVSSIALIEVNAVQTPDNLAVGTELLIPGYQPGPESGATSAQAGEDTGSTAPAAPVQGEAPSVVHVVQLGDTLLSIAIDYGVDPNDIASANNIANRNLLRLGQELVIPGVSAQDAAAARGNTHIVQSGESLLGIAARYDVDVEALIAANDIQDADSLVVGQELVIPE